MVLDQVKKYREGGRIPILAYLHPHTKVGWRWIGREQKSWRVHATRHVYNLSDLVLVSLGSFQMPLLRSAQPMTSSNVKRRYEDEQLLRMVLETSGGVNGIIFDTRSTSVITAHMKKVS